MRALLERFGFRQDAGAAGAEALAASAEKLYRSARWALGARAALKMRQQSLEGAEDLARSFGFAGCSRDWKKSLPSLIPGLLCGISVARPCAAGRSGEKMRQLRAVESGAANEEQLEAWRASPSPQLSRLALLDQPAL